MGSKEPQKSNPKKPFEFSDADFCETLEKLLKVKPTTNKELANKKDKPKNKSGQKNKLK